MDLPDLFISIIYQRVNLSPVDRVEDRVQGEIFIFVQGYENSPLFLSIQIQLDQFPEPVFPFKGQDIDVVFNDLKVPDRRIIIPENENTFQVVTHSLEIRMVLEICQGIPLEMIRYLDPGILFFYGVNLFTPDIIDIDPELTGTRVDIDPVPVHRFVGNSGHGKDKSFGIIDFHITDEYHLRRIERAVIDRKSEALDIFFIRGGSDAQIFSVDGKEQPIDTDFLFFDVGAIPIEKGHFHFAVDDQLVLEKTHG